MCPDKYRDEFERNNSWLRFGFHTINGDTNYADSCAEKITAYYERTIEQLIKIVGDGSIDNVIRLQNFAGTEECINALRSLEIQPVVGLLTADENRKSYNLPSYENGFIFCHDRLEFNDMTYFSADIRIEYIENVRIVSLYLGIRMGRLSGEMYQDYPRNYIELRNGPLSHGIISRVMGLISTKVLQKHCSEYDSFKL